MDGAGALEVATGAGTVVLDGTAAGAGAAEAVAGEDNATGGIVVADDVVAVGRDVV